MIEEALTFLDSMVKITIKLELFSLLMVRILNMHNYIFTTLKMKLNIEWMYSMIVKLIVALTLLLLLHWSEC